MNRTLATVVACPLTTKLHPTWHSRIQIICDGLPAEIAVDQFRTRSKLRIVKKLGKLAPQEATILWQLITEIYRE